ncbi:MAG: helix-turn-helix domain-containing protein [Dehalococcoidia bacterium]
MTVAGDFTGRRECSVHQSDDACVHSRSATDWSHVYEQLQPGRFHGTHAEAWLGPVQICYERVDGAFKYYGRAWHGSRVFLSFLPGSGDIHYDGRPVANEVLLTNRWDAVDRVTCSRQAELLVVTIDEAFFERYAAEVAGRTFFASDDGSPVVCTRDKRLVSAFERSVADALAALSDNPGLFDDDMARRAIRHSILGPLCDVLLAQPPDEMRLPSSSTRSYIVDKAIEFIEAKLADQLSIPDVCATIRVCERTLRYSFEQVLGVTPSQYIRATRLNRVRRELATGRQSSIESAAVRWGFWHMGHFARYYRQTFGEHPSATIQAAPKARGGRVPAASLPVRPMRISPDLYGAARRCIAV